LLLALEFHDITGPLDYFLLKPWMIFCAVAGVLLVIGLTTWLIKLWRNRPIAVVSPRQRALDRLARIQSEIDKLSPYQFSNRAISIAGDPADFSGVSECARREFTILQRRTIAPERFPEPLRPDQVRSLRRHPRG
jgi:hypothetical protein